jgi:hypothetical protein
MYCSMQRGRAEWVASSGELGAGLIMLPKKTFPPCKQSHAPVRVGIYQCCAVYLSRIYFLPRGHILCPELRHTSRLIQPFTDRTATICRKEACCAFRISGVRNRYVSLLAWVLLSGAGPGRACLKVKAAVPRGRGGPNVRRTHSLA